MRINKAMKELNGEGNRVKLNFGKMIIIKRRSSFSCRLVRVLNKLFTGISEGNYYYFVGFQLTGNQ